MKSILTKLYRGEIDPLAEFHPKAEEHIALCKKILKTVKILLKHLNIIILISLINLYR